MTTKLPGAVPEIPVSDIDASLEYYRSRLGFNVDWRGEGLAGISKGSCRMFLADAAFRSRFGNRGPVLTWLNLDGNEDVDALHQLWRANDAMIVAPPESKPWGLYEFAAADPDGNLLRVFYDFATPEREKSAPRRGGMS